MKVYKIIDTTSQIVVEPRLEADFLYAQPSGTTTLHRFRTGCGNKSDIVAVVPANLLILEV